MGTVWESDGEPKTISSVSFVLISRAILSLSPGTSNRQMFLNHVGYVEGWVLTEYM